MDQNHQEYIAKGRKLVKRLEELQYNFSNGRPEWIFILKNDLKLFIATLYYDYPSYDDEIAKICNVQDSVISIYDNSDIIFKQYKKEIQDKVLIMIEQIVKEHFKLHLSQQFEVGVSQIYSICKNKCDKCQCFPEKDIHQWILLRIKLMNNEVMFIDFQRGRLYIGWNDFMENNTLPEGYVFYPQTGFYDAANNLIQNITPASNKVEKVLKHCDLASNIGNVAGGIVVGLGFIFPLAIPITIIAAGTIAVSSAFTGVRKLNRIIDIYKHHQILNSTNKWLIWVDLALASVGFISAPFHVLGAIVSDVNSTVTIVKGLSIIRKSACIAQCTIEIFRATLEFIDNNFEISLQSILNLRLDLFIVTGILMSTGYIKNILEILSLQSVWMPIYKTMEQIPYCLAQRVWNSTYFFKNHFAVFVEQLTMFLVDKLTPENLLFAWQKIRHIMDSYQKQTAELDTSDLLRHVVDGIEEGETVKYALRGRRMVELLDSLQVGNRKVHRALVKYCVDRVLRKAVKLSALHKDCVIDLARLGETNERKVDEEFCKMYGLERCTMDQYVMHAIGEFGKDPVALMAQYKEYSSFPENMYDEEQVVSDSVGSNQSFKAYSLVAPCSVLDLEMCLQFADRMNPQPHRYVDHEFKQPEPGVSLLFRVSVYSIEIIFFGVDLINGVPKMKICFFQDTSSTASSFSSKNGMRELQSSQVAH